MELLASGDIESEIGTLLVDSELVPVTIRVSHGLRSSAKEAASPTDLASISVVKRGMIEQLASSWKKR